MNLCALQNHDYESSCHKLDLDDLDKDKWGLFLLSFSINDVDSYLMDWVELKTLHDNVERLYKSLNKSVRDELNK